jgi:methylenetetrahydrofolate--tRNA-(uracil-5-)-methyltransferase
VTDSGSEILVIGGGLAGSEAAWQAAQRGVCVKLYEMRPDRSTPVHQTGLMAELVCSNSLGSNQPDHALGILKNEMRRLDSLVIACADRTALPAGSALAVSRDDFSHAITEAILSHPNISVRREEVTEVPQGCPVVMATGPLTSPALSEALRRMAGQDHLHFFDAMAPIVTAESINMNVAFRASRYAQGQGAEGHGDEPEGDYINCPMTRDQYHSFVEAVKHAQTIKLEAFDEDAAARRYFEGCLPIEVLAERSPEALSYGPLRPVGLRDPRTGRGPFAVVQLRQDNIAGTLYNLVGFQTNLKWGEQERVLRMIPGLEGAEFVRFGQLHRNTFINSPVLLRPSLAWRDRDDLFFAGQVTGTEGYVGSAAGGLLAGINASRVARGQKPVELSTLTMMGALFHYITHADPAHFQPMKANHGLLPPLDVPIRGRRDRGKAYASRARAALESTIKDL